MARMARQSSVMSATGISYTPADQPGCSVFRTVPARMCRATAPRQHCAGALLVLEVESPLVRRVRGPSQPPRSTLAASVMADRHRRLRSSTRTPGSVGELRPAVGAAGARRGLRPAAGAAAQVGLLIEFPAFSGTRSVSVRVQTCQLS